MLLLRNLIEILPAYSACAQRCGSCSVSFKRRRKYSFCDFFFVMFIQGESLNTYEKLENISRH